MDGDYSVGYPHLGATHLFILTKRSLFPFYFFNLYFSIRKSPILQKGNFPPILLILVFRLINWVYVQLYSTAKITSKLHILINKTHWFPNKFMTKYAVCLDSWLPPFLKQGFRSLFFLPMFLVFFSAENKAIFSLDIPNK